MTTNKKLTKKKIFLGILMAILGAFGFNVAHVEETQAKQVCASFSYSVSGPGTYGGSVNETRDTREICADVDDNGAILNVDGTTTKNFNASIKTTGSSPAGLPDIVAKGTVGRLIHIDCVPGLSSFTNARAYDCDENISVRPGDDWNDLINKIYNTIPQEYTRSDVDTSGKTFTYSRQDLDPKALVEKTTTPTEGENNGEESGETAAGEEGGAEQHACYDNSGAVGWILCPVIDMATGAVNGLYGVIEENFLKIDVQGIFGSISGDNNESSEGVYGAWSVFRDIANVVFVILFVIVILSQVTGFGIDNYGIKKILPKLIIVAVLINLSFIICQLAVDVSNILGVGLRGFLQNLVPESSTAVGTNPSGVQWVVTMGGTTLAIGGVIAAGFFTGAGVGAVIAIVCAIITALVAVFFLWIILVVRSAGIIILIAIAPLAIACFLLPNTEKLGKRWLDILKALLILYPLCSLAIGAGSMAGRILSSSGNEVMILAAMIVQVVPFFFIPALLKQSLAGMGNIGAKLSSIGQAQGAKLSGKAQGAIDRTNWAQNRRFNTAKRRTSLAMKAANYSKGRGKDTLLAGKLAGIVGGSAQTQARRLATLEKAEAQELAGSRLLARQDLGAAEVRFNELASKEGNLSKKEQAELNGIISEFANTPGYANKIVKKIANGEAKASFVEAVAAHAANNSDVSAAINGKNAVMAQYLADVHKQGNNVTAESGYEAYNEANRARIAEGMSDKEIASQSPDSMRNLLNTDQSRIAQIADNQKIMSEIDQENAQMVRDAAAAPESKVGYLPQQRSQLLEEANLPTTGWTKVDGENEYQLDIKDTNGNITTHRFDILEGKLKTP